MRYIIEGRSVDKVLQENRIRIARGEIKVTPLADDVQKNCPAVPEQEAEEVPEEAPEQEAAPVVPEQETQQEAAPEVPEVPVTDEKEAPAEDTKEAPAVEDAKDVEPEADTKEAPAEDTKAAPRKSTGKKK